MKRGASGRYEVTSVGGERVRAFVPSRLPPKPPLEFTGDIQRLLEEATHSVGRLDAASPLLPDRRPLLYSYIRKEAVLSSKIEGTQSSLTDLLRFELEDTTSVPFDDVKEVSNYVSALEYGIQRLDAGFPLSLRLIREIHAKLLASGRGSRKEPGEFRRSQNWIGGARPGNAIFVPPPHTLVPDCLGDLEKFLNAAAGSTSALVRAGLAHVQFESIHPFLDGNGRVGRLLIALLLHHERLLKEPILYVSLYLKQHRSTYYDLLDLVRSDGDWEAWMEFFLRGIKETADDAYDTGVRLQGVYGTDGARVASQGRRSAAAQKVHRALTTRPILSLAETSRLTGLSFPGASAGMRLLVGLGIVREVTGRRRRRLFAYDEILRILNEGTDSP